MYTLTYFKKGQKTWIRKETYEEISELVKGLKEINPEWWELKNPGDVVINEG